MVRLPSFEVALSQWPMYLTGLFNTIWLCAVTATLSLFLATMLTVVMMHNHVVLRKTAQAAVDTADARRGLGVRKNTRARSSHETRISSCMVAVLVGILVNNSRLSDQRAHMDKRFDGVDKRFDDLRAVMAIGYRGGSRRAVDVLLAAIQNGGVIETARRFRKNQPKHNPIIFCGHINLLPAALMARKICGGSLYLIIHGIEAWKPTRSPLLNLSVRHIDDFIAVSNTTRRRFLRWSRLR